MSSGRLPTHTRRLASKVNQPGGLTEEEAVTAATANLETMRERTETELKLVIQQLRQIEQAMQVPPSPAAVDELYALANLATGIAGVFGMGAVSAVAYSLCEMIDRLRSAGVWNQRAVRIHVDSLVLIQGPDFDPAQERPILAALAKLLDFVPT